ncbi:MAG: 6-bladed beta-propeller [Candidatus Krumholzibacteriota bacterium]
MRSTQFSIVLLFLFSSVFAAESIPVIDNPRETPRVNEVHFEEVWRAGADDGEEFLFGVISDAVCDAEGNIYLLDTQQQQVFKFSASGEYLGLVSRKGEGPGEIDRVYNLHAPGDGRIAMSKGFPAKIIMVDTEGTPQPGLTLEIAPTEGKEPGFPMLSALAFTGDHLVVMGKVMHGDGMRQNNTTFVARFDKEGREVHRYTQWSSGYDFTKAIVVDELDQYHPFNNWDMADDGRIFHTVERESYLVQVVSPEGEPLLMILREWPVHKRTKEEKEKAKNRYSFGSNVDLPPISYEIADEDPAISGLGIHGDELWITSTEQSRQDHPGVARAVSVFDLDGHLIEDRYFLLPRNPEEDKLTYLPDGRVVRVKAFRSAHAASIASQRVQVGDKRLSSEDHDEEVVLEVIVYQPVSR